jgi:sporulation and spore germination protein
MNRHYIRYGALAALALAGMWVLFVVLPRRYGPRQTNPPPPSAASEPKETRKIKARLFYVSADGMRLVTAERDVVYGEGTLEQGRRLIEAQLAPAAAPLVSAIPAGTKLRDLFLASDGAAFVDLSPEVTTAHPGGALTELLTVYTIVDVLTENLPAITSVQILVDGKEADTLAGHVDLRRPLGKDLRWTDQAPAEESSKTPGTQ